MGACLTFLILFPLAAGLLALVLPGRARELLVPAAGAVIAAGAVAAAALGGNGPPQFLGLPFALDTALPVFLAEEAIALLLVALSVAHRRWDALALAAAQASLALWLERSGRLPAPEPERLFSFDRLTLVMVLVVGLIGPLICVHAVGYMRDYHRHDPGVRGRPAVFFFLVLAFLAAMFGLVCANDLPLLHLFWELTTLCSFLLIGYTRTPETIGYAFHALRLNLLGGLGFTVALALLATSPGGLDLARLVAGPASAALLPAVALLALAGLTKSAQLPFSSWLLGAMYAPTPTSALLHSSTMVKAGVFLLLRLSPAMAGSSVGTAVALVGFLTFLAASLISTTEPNAKRVLAWSTISNLGLVAGCAGVASPALVWVGVMVIVFHAAAKSLLFLVVGSLENRLHTKDLEHFDNLLSRFPGLSVLMLVGVTGMALAPFGVVLAKWSAIRALLEVPGWQGPLYVLALAYGSACTLYTWVKLLMKVVAVRAVAPEERALEAQVSPQEWFAEAAHAVLVVALTLSVGALSERVVGPYALEAFGAGPAELLHVGWPLVVALAVGVLALPALALGVARRGHYRFADIYTSGRGADERHLVESASGGSRAVSLRNYYLKGVVDGSAVLRAGTALGAALVVLMLSLPALVLR